MIFPQASKTNAELIYYKLSIFEKLFPFYATVGLDNAYRTDNHGYQRQERDILYCKDPEVAAVYRISVPYFRTWRSDGILPVMHP